MALDTTTSVGEHLQVRLGSSFNSGLQTAFTIFVDFEYTATAANRRIWWFRKAGGTYAWINTSNQFTISDGVRTYTLTALSLSTGRYLVAATWNDTTLNVRIKPVGGSETTGSTTTFNPGSFSAKNPGVAWGTREADVAVPTIHSASAWSSVLGDNHLDSLMGLYPANLIPVQPFWMPGWGSEGDYGLNRTAASPGDLQATLTGAPAQNMSVLRDPSTHAPINFSGTYYAVGNDGGESDLELYSSTNLTAWTYVEDITTAAGESLTAIGASDFIYDAGASRPYQVLYWGESGGDNDMYIISTASMSSRTWTNETNNPVFLASDVTGHATSNGPEDFRITMDDAGDWVAVFEHNNESPGNAVGLAKNTSARLADAFSYTGDMLDGAVTDDVVGTSYTYGSAQDIYANPVIVYHDSWYWCFFEHRVGSSSTDSNVTCHARSKDPGDPTSWIPLGFAVTVDALENGSDPAVFPNGATVESGKIRLYMQSNKKYVYEGLDQIYVPGMFTPGAGMLPIYGASGSGGSDRNITGALAAAAFAMSSAGTVLVSATSAMQPAAATADGAAAVQVRATGAMESGASTTSGAMTVLVAATGALTAAAASIASAATVLVSGAGALVSGAATVVGRNVAAAVGRFTRSITQSITRSIRSAIRRANR